MQSFQNKKILDNNQKTQKHLQNTTKIKTKCNIKNNIQIQKKINKENIDKYYLTMLILTYI